MGLNKNKFFLLSSHREENIDSQNFYKLITLIENLIEQFNFPVLISTHPRTRKKIEKEKIKLSELAIMHKPLNFTDYSKLQLSAKAVLSDSGSITEESSILNFPALNIREAHERPEGFEEAAVMMTGLESGRVLNALQILENQPSDKERILSLVQDYSTPNLSEKIVRIILSYIDYVDNNIWRKNK